MDYKKLDNLMKNYHDNKDFEKAEKVLEQVIKKVNLNLNLKEIMKICDDYGYYEKNIQILQNVLNEREINGNVKEFAEIQIKERLYNFAERCFTDFDYENALSFGFKAIEFDNNSLELKKLIGNIYFELENYSDSLEHYLEYVEVNSNDSEVLRNIGISYLEHGQYDKAKSYLERGLELNPDDSLILAKLGFIFLDLDDFDNAIKFYESSLAKSVNKFSVEWRNLGSAHLSHALSLLSSKDDVNKMFDILSRAKKYYDKAFEEEEKWHYPEDPDFDTWFEYGEINFYLGERDIAKEAFLKAKSINSKLWEYFEGDDFFEMMKADEEIVQKLISNYIKSKKKKKKFIYYCRICKTSYGPLNSLQKTLDGKYLCPKHGKELEKFKDIRF